MDLKECMQKGFIKRASRNKSLAKSLIEMSAIKQRVVEETQMNAYNISAFVPMAYDSLRGIMEGICVMHGYKVTSHICIETLLETIYPQTHFSDFERFRYIRNSINYHGEQIGLEPGEEVIEKIFVMKARLILLLKQLL